MNIELTIRVKNVFLLCLLSNYMYLNHFEYGSNNYSERQITLPKHLCFLILSSILKESKNSWLLYVADYSLEPINRFVINTHNKRFEINSSNVEIFLNFCGLHSDHLIVICKQLTMLFSVKNKTSY